MPNRTRIVIVGGGYTGIWSKRFFQGNAEVICISPKPYHSYHGWTAETITGAIQVQNRQSPLHTIFDKLIIGSVKQIHAKKNCIDVQTDHQLLCIPYDHLVLAYGTEDKLDTVHGLERYGYSLKTPGAVQKVSIQLETIQNIRDKTCVIAGGGLTGIEVAGHIAQQFPDIEVILVHPGIELITEFHRFPKLREYLIHELQIMGVQIITQARLSSVSAEGALLSNNHFIPSKLVISTLGQRAIHILGTEQFPLTEDGFIICDKHLNVLGFKNIWTGGDMAHVLVDGIPCPKNALWAIMMGKQIGINISNELRGKVLAAFHFESFGHAASVGFGKAVTELYGFQFTGWIAWFMRLVFFLYFQPSRQRASQIAINWLQFKSQKQKRAIALKSMK